MQHRDKHSYCKHADKVQFSQFFLLILSFKVKLRSNRLLPNCKHHDCARYIFPWLFITGQYRYLGVSTVKSATRAYMWRLSPLAQKSNASSNSYPGGFVFHVGALSSYALYDCTTQGFMQGVEDTSLLILFRVYQPMSANVVEIQAVLHWVARISSAMTASLLRGSWMLVKGNRAVKAMQC